MNNIASTYPNLYIGIDIHKKSWYVHIRSDVSDHKGFSMPPNYEILANYIEANFPKYTVHLCYEAGCCGFSSARNFGNLGWNISVVNPADIPMGDKAYYQKTDKHDARNLCKLLQLNQLKSIYIPDQEHEMLTSLVRQRNNIVKMLRKTKCLIKSQLLFQGIPIPLEYDNPNWSINFKEWLSQLRFDYTPGKISLDSKLKVLNLLHQEYLEIGNQLRAYCRTHFKKDYYLLKSIPGIGGFLAAAILSEIGDIRRFNNEREFSCYIGMVPGMRQSGNSENKMGITPRCKSLIRSYLIEASWVALRLDPEIQMYYRNHVGKNPKTIIVKIGHKLVKRIFSVIKNNKEYEINHTLNKQEIKE